MESGILNMGLEISPEILKLISELDEFKGRWEAFKTLSPQRLSELRKVATIESIASSTRIEGSKLSDAEVARLLSGLRTDTFKNRDEEEVVGYADAMDLVFESWSEISLTENHIKQLHTVLLKHSSKDQRHKGEYKKLSNSVAAFDADGKQLGIVFETAMPFDTPGRMQELVNWEQRAMHDGTLHPLLLIAIFIVVFLAIHPFQDGNGRLSRILTTLLLLQNGYIYVPYASLENIVEEHKTQYYTALRQTQGTLKQNQPQWTPWVLFFLKCLKIQKDRLLKKVSQEKALLVDLPALSVKILDLLKKHGRLNSADLEKFTKANKNTIKVRLRDLLASQHIERHGQARATWYSLK